MARPRPRGPAAARGAEGDVRPSSWRGLPAVTKSRAPKPYRDPELDAALRRQRTVREAEALRDVKALGVLSPLVYYVDVARCEITMQRVPGPLARRAGGPRLRALCRGIGRAAGLMHRGGIAHGDLTTANFIESRRGLCAIDFGLSSRTSRAEDHAVDLRLFREVLSSAHAEDMAGAWAAFLSGYGRAVGAARRRAVERVVSDIESRGRYARVV